MSSIANSYEVIQYKQTAMSLIANDEAIFDLIDNKQVKYADDLAYVNIFPYMRIPETEKEEKTYIFICVDMPHNINRNNLLKDMVITLVIVTHQNLMRIDNVTGTRIDVLSNMVDKLFNGKDVFGIGNLQLVSNFEGNLDKTHYCRTLKFKTMDFNNRIQ